METVIQAAIVVTVIYLFGRRLRGGGGGPKPVLPDAISPAFGVKTAIAIQVAAATDAVDPVTLVLEHRPRWSGVWVTAGVDYRHVAKSGLFDVDVAGLLPGGIYDFRVTAKNAAGTDQRTYSGLLYAVVGGGGEPVAKGPLIVTVVAAKLVIDAPVGTNVVTVEYILTPSAPYSGLVTLSLGGIDVFETWRDEATPKSVAFVISSGNLVAAKVKSATNLATLPLDPAIVTVRPTFLASAPSVREPGEPIARTVAAETTTAIVAYTITPNWGYTGTLTLVLMPWTAPVDSVFNDAGFSTAASSAYATYTAAFAAGSPTIKTQASWANGSKSPTLIQFNVVSVGRFRMGTMTGSMAYFPTPNLLTLTYAQNPVVTISLRKTSFTVVPNATSSVYVPPAILGDEPLPVSVVYTVKPANLYLGVISLGFPTMPRVSLAWNETPGSSTAKTMTVTLPGRKGTYKPTFLATPGARFEPFLPDFIVSDGASFVVTAVAPFEIYYPAGQSTPPLATFRIARPTGFTGTVTIGKQDDIANTKSGTFTTALNTIELAIKVPLSHQNGLFEPAATIAADRGVFKIGIPTTPTTMTYVNGPAGLTGNIASVYVAGKAKVTISVASSNAAKLVVDGKIDVEYTVTISGENCWWMSSTEASFAYSYRGTNYLQVLPKPVESGAGINTLAVAPPEKGRKVQFPLFLAVERSGPVEITIGELTRCEVTNASWPVYDANNGGFAFVLQGTGSIEADFVDSTKFFSADSTVVPPIGWSPDLSMDSVVLGVDHAKGAFYTSATSIATVRETSPLGGDFIVWNTLTMQPLAPNTPTGSDFVGQAGGNYIRIAANRMLRAPSSISSEDGRFTVVGVFKAMLLAAPSDQRSFALLAYGSADGMTPRDIVVFRTALSVVLVFVDSELSLVEITLPVPPGAFALGIRVADESIEIAASGVDGIVVRSDPTFFGSYGNQISRSLTIGGCPRAGAADLRLWEGGSLGFSDVALFNRAITVDESTFLLEWIKKRRVLT